MPVQHGEILTLLLPVLDGWLATVVLGNTPVWIGFIWFKRETLAWMFKDVAIFNPTKQHHHLIQYDLSGFHGC